MVEIEEKKPLGSAGSLKVNIKKSRSKYTQLLLMVILFQKLTSEPCKNIEKKCDLTVCIKDHKIDIPYAILTKKKAKSSFLKKNQQ